MEERFCILTSNDYIDFVFQVFYFHSVYFIFLCFNLFVYLFVHFFTRSGCWTHGLCMLGKTSSSAPSSQHSYVPWFEDFIFILEFCFEQQENMKAKKNYPIRKCLECFLPCPWHIYSGAKPINWKSYLSVLLFQTCPSPFDLGPILLEFLRLNFLHVWSQESL